MSSPIKSLSKNNEVLLYAYSMGYHTDGQGHVISSRGNCLRLNADTKGYLYFNVKFLSRSKKVGVHRLVAYQKFGDALFVEDIQVRHLDGNHLNNAWNNIAVSYTHLTLPTSDLV